MSVVGLLVEREKRGTYWPYSTPGNVRDVTLERLAALGQEVHVDEGQAEAISATAESGVWRRESRMTGITHRGTAMPPDDGS